MGKDGYIDPFDVAIGQASFVDYLLERYDEMDLNTRLEFEPEDRIEEVVARIPEPEPEVILESGMPQPDPAEAGTTDIGALVAQFHAAARDYEERNR